MAKIKYMQEKNKTNEIQFMNKQQKNVKFSITRIIKIPSAAYIHIRISYINIISLEWMARGMKIQFRSQMLISHLFSYSGFYILLSEKHKIRLSSSHTTVLLFLYFFIFTSSPEIHFHRQYFFPLHLNLLTKKYFVKCVT